MAEAERPGERRGNARTAVVWDALQPLLEHAGSPLDVVDIGGGTGGFAVKVARLGHRVTVVDPSPDALAALARRAQEVGVDVDGRQGDVSSLVDVVGTDSADLVLCHGVLEVAGDPATALTTLRDVLRDRGTLSLLAAQRTAVVIARAMAGQFAEARELLDETGQIGRTGRRFSRDELTALVAGSGFTVTTTHGVRVFADLVPGALLDLEPGMTSALVELERAVAERPEFSGLATQLHLVAVK